MCGLALLFLAGCTTVKKSDTARTGIEQLLISSAVDNALDKVDFRPFAGHSVFLEDKYIDCTDKAYIVGSVRHRALRAGAKLVDKAEAADMIVEVRSGGVGTDDKESYVGTPQMSVSPLLTIPETRFYSRSTQTGIAKIGIVAYDAKSRQALGHGGLARAQTENDYWSLMGIGPVNHGTLPREVAVAKSKTAYPLELEGEQTPGLKLGPTIEQAAFFESPPASSTVAGQGDETPHLLPGAVPAGAAK